VLVAVLVAAAFAGCGGSAGSSGATDFDPTAADVDRVADPDQAAGACLTGVTECADVPTGTDGPESRPDGSLWLADALDAGVDGPFLVAAYYVDDSRGARLCAGLLESFPPQCGEPSLALGDRARIDEAALTSEGGVTWSADPVTVEGEIVGDTFAPR
jgi:hypothetical protein